MCEVPLIKKINIDNTKDAEDVLNVQLPSYKIEAEMHTLQQCGETFFGYYEVDKLCGAISIKVTDGEVDIHRLIVLPNHFRKGIAQQLLNFVESEYDVQTIIVSTGTKNIPAVRFYKKNGFIKIKDVAVNKQLSISFFEKKL